MVLRGQTCRAPQPKPRIPWIALEQDHLPARSQRIEDGLQEMSGIALIQQVQADRAIGHRPLPHLPKEGRSVVRLERHGPDWIPAPGNRVELAAENAASVTEFENSLPGQEVDQMPEGLGPPGRGALSGRGSRCSRYQSRYLWRSLRTPRDASSSALKPEFIRS